MNQKLLAIIPARGGSKRIPRKNIRNFLGKPMISYAIKTAIDANCFDEIMVSTENMEIATIAQKYGAAVPFMRSPQTATDSAHLGEVICEVLNEYKQRDKIFPYFCCIFATSPLLTTEQILMGKKLLFESQADSIIPVTEFSSPIQRALQIKNNKLIMIQPQNYFVRSQDFTPTYHDCGLFYWANSTRFLKEGKILMNNSIPLLVRESHCQDIDTKQDWKIAEIKYYHIFRKTHV